MSQQFRTPAEIEAAAESIQQAASAPRADEFVTSSGVTLRIKPINQMLAAKAHMAIESEVRKSLIAEFGDDCFTQPTYTLETPDGGKETHPHDDATIASTPSQADHYRCWQQATERFDVDHGMRLVDFMIASSVKVEIDDDDLAEAIAVREMFGLPLPETDLQNKITYVLDVALASEDDYQKFMAVVNGSGNVPAAEVDAAADSFRGELRPEAGTTGQPAAGAIETSMVDVAGLPGDDHGTGVAPDAGAMGARAGLVEGKNDGVPAGDEPHAGVRVVAG